VKIKLEAAARLTATHWWDALDKEQKQEYLSEHPDSKYAKQGSDKTEREQLADDEVVDEKPKKAPKSKAAKSKDDSLTHFLYEKGKGALSGIGRKALEKSKKGILHRLIDPMGLTHPK
jgi:hypothetical protein